MQAREIVTIDLNQLNLRWAKIIISHVTTLHGDKVGESKITLL